MPKHKTSDLSVTRRALRDMVERSKAHGGFFAKLAGPQRPMGLVKRFVQFLALKAFHEDVGESYHYSPGPVLDDVWHDALLHPASYNALCITLCGRIIDHNPKHSPDGVETRIARTRDAFKRYFNAKMPEETTLVDVINLEEEKKKAKPFFVKTLTGKTIVLDWDDGLTVGQACAMIHEREGIPLNQQRLVFSGKTLSPTQCMWDENADAEVVAARNALLETKLREYGCQFECTLTLILNLRGC